MYKPYPYPERVQIPMENRSWGYNSSQLQTVVSTGHYGESIIWVRAYSAVQQHRAMSIAHLLTHLSHPG